MMKILSVFETITKRNTLFHLFLLTLLFLFSPFYLPLQIVSEHSVEWDGWLRIEGLLLQLATLKSALRFALNFFKSIGF